MEPVEGLELLEKRRGMSGVSALNGPAKLTMVLGIDSEYNGHDLRLPPIKLLTGNLKTGEVIASSPRIGISLAKDIHRRYYISGNPYVSR